MKYGIAFGRFVDEGSGSFGGGELAGRGRNAGGNESAFGVETRAFGAVIADVELYVAGKLTLDIEIPDLDVAETIVGIESVIIGHSVDRLSGKTILQGQKISVGADVGGGDGERWLEGKVADEGAVLSEIVIDAIAGANDGALGEAVGDADARREIIAIGTNERRGIGGVLAGEDLESRWWTGD